MGHVPVFAAIKCCSLERTCSSNDFCKFVADSCVLWSRSLWKYEQRKLSKLKWPLQFGTFQGQWTKNRNKKNKLLTAGRQTRCLCATEAEEFIISEVFSRASFKDFRNCFASVALKSLAYKSHATFWTNQAWSYFSRAFSRHWRWQYEFVYVMIGSFNWLRFYYPSRERNHCEQPLVSLSEPASSTKDE